SSASNLRACSNPSSARTVTSCGGPRLSSALGDPATAPRRTTALHRRVKKEFHPQHKKEKCRKVKILEANPNNPIIRGLSPRERPALGRTPLLASLDDTVSGIHQNTY